MGFPSPSIDYITARTRRPHLEDLDKPERKVQLPGPDDTGLEICIRGVVTHVLNDARAGEFNDVPVM